MFINGTYNILYIDYGSGFFPIACLTTNSFEEDVDKLETTTRDNTNGWRTYTMLNQGYNIPFEGIVINTLFAKGDFTKISYDRLKEIKRNRQLIDWKIQDNELQFIESGKGFIDQLSSASRIDDFVTFSGNILGYGEPTSTTGLFYPLQDGNDNIIEDGNNNEIIV